MSSNIAISINNVSKKYEMYANPKERLLQMLPFGKRQYFKEFWALNDVSFDVKRGETLGVLGRNGSGKSTLLQIIAGTLSQTHGDLTVNGKLAALLELGSGFNPEFSGRENVYLNGTILGFTKSEMDEKFHEIESFADIGDHIDQPVKTYSSGMYVRLAFAVQACVKPDILIVDEALSVGDEKFQRKCFDYIDELRKSGCSILIVTHSTATVEKFCQRAVLLHKGCVQGVGAAKEIVDQYHALLYSDEKTYMRYVNQKNNEGEDSKVEKNIEGDTESLKPEKMNENKSERSGAYITSWDVLDQSGKHCEVFRTGDKAVINFTTEVLGSVKEIQAGVLIRTVEGVPVFGTSTLYHQLNYTAPEDKDKLRASFELDVNLCEGTYFITLAIAEAISHADMAYLDRKTDVIIIKVSEPRANCSGIAALPVKVNFDKANVNSI
ncbi:ABC transporter ATP-binding protein [Photobacterium sp. TY1-4]|uniref:ABC transporter ATP-binding protein n=1 Tax=Photobacterium sp. TY1-4 TaxID=2899122 RepID=UPI0021C0DC88|nr:ABC transporter ATP-binding protein [Photobacterium sp. TY1-4]UXI00543.1 ABC transporter ATP-binding protein [Photobacterium sp. TY1-4]